MTTEPTLQPLNSCEFVGCVSRTPAGFISRFGKKMARVEIEIPSTDGRGTPCRVTVLGVNDNAEKIAALKFGDRCWIRGRLEGDVVGGRPEVHVHARIVKSEASELSKSAGA